MAPLSNSNEKTLCCLCCALGPVLLSVTTDRGGYCPGESITISTEAENHTSRKVMVVQASLKQTVTFFPEDILALYLTSFKGFRALALRWEVHQFNELLFISVTVTSISSCCILKVSYILQVTLTMPGGINLHVILRPITIR